MEMAGRGPIEIAGEVYRRGPIWRNQRFCPGDGGGIDGRSSGKGNPELPAPESGSGGTGRGDRTDRSPSASHLTFFFRESSWKRPDPLAESIGGKLFDDAGADPRRS